MTSIITTTISRRIAAAARSKAAAQRDNYTVKPFAGQTGMFDVAHVKNEAIGYVVDTKLHTCTCPAFEADNYCKHYALVQLLAREEAEATAHEEATAARADADNASEWETENIH